MVHMFQLWAFFFFSNIHSPILQGMLTGLMGNMSLLSYFVKKREKEVVVVQTLGAVSIFVVLCQLAAAEAMPLPHFVATSTFVVTGLILNFFNYFGLVSAPIWRFWEDFITVGGFSVLPQVNSPPLFLRSSSYSSYLTSAQIDILLSIDPPHYSLI